MKANSASAHVMSFLVCFSNLSTYLSHLGSLVEWRSDSENQCYLWFQVTLVRLSHLWQSLGLKLCGTKAQRLGGSGEPSKSTSYGLVDNRRSLSLWSWDIWDWVHFLAMWFCSLLANYNSECAESGTQLHGSSIFPTFWLLTFKKNYSFFWPEFSKMVIIIQSYFKT